MGIVILTPSMLTSNVSWPDMSCRTVFNSFYWSYRLCMNTKSTCVDISVSYVYIYISRIYIYMYIQRNILTKITF